VQTFPQSDHCDGTRFFNPSGPRLQPFRAVPRLLLERRTRWPKQIEDPPRPLPAVDGSTMVVTFIGHATFLIQTAAGNLLIDPVFARRAGPFALLGPKRARPPALHVDDLPPISTVLLSHNHYDHCDVRALGELARRFDPLVVTPLGNGALVRSTGIRRIEERDWWEGSAQAPWPITLTPAHHFSARGPFDRNRALWSGFMLTVGGRRLYVAGDTAYVPFFGEIRERLGPIDIALLPIGAYEPRWFMRSVHMNPSDAVQAHLDLGGPETIGMHFGTFQLTTEGIDAPLVALDQACATRDVARSRFRTLGVGDSTRIS
jgi:L-ascorbate metabolism protein UlaG (beta-lactamase superfamily)